MAVAKQNDINVMFADKTVAKWKKEYNIFNYFHEIELEHQKHTKWKHELIKQGIAPYDRLLYYIIRAKNITLTDLNRLAYYNYNNPPEYLLPYSLELLCMCHYLGAPPRLSAAIRKKLVSTYHRNTT